MIICYYIFDESMCEAAPGPFTGGFRDKRETMVTRPSWFPFQSFSRRRRAQFYHAVGHVLESGIPVLQAMEIVTNTADTPRLRRIAKAMKQHIEAGGTFASAFALFPNDFPATETRMIAAAEFAGKTPNVLFRLSDYLSWFATTLRSMFITFIYPALLLLVAFVFMPIFTALFLGGMEYVLVFLVRSAVALGGWILIGVIFWKLMKQWPAFGAWFHGFVLKWPFIGPTLRQVVRARFSRMLECMYASGVPLTEALAYAADGCGNLAIARRLRKAEPILKAGSTLAGALRESHVLTPLALGMIEVGETAGNLEILLVKYAEQEEREAALKIEVIARVIPMMVYILIVCYLAYAFIFRGFYSLLI